MPPDVSFDSAMSTANSRWRIADTSKEVLEQGDTEPVIVHHTILKADIRGSTTVTQELLRQSLYPASFFSLRFFPFNFSLLFSWYSACKITS